MTTWKQLHLRASPKLFMAADPDLQFKDFTDELTLGNLWGAMGRGRGVTGGQGALAGGCELPLGWQVLGLYAILDHNGVFWDMRIVSPRFMAEGLLRLASGTHCFKLGK
eukprot:5156124-Amphidinium_carterae.3